MTDILYELSLDINTQDFNKCFIKRNCKSLTKISPDECADYSYIDQGLLFIFRNSKYKKKVSVSGVREQYAVCSDEKGNRCKSCTNSSL